MYLWARISSNNHIISNDIQRISRILSILHNAKAKSKVLIRFAFAENFQKLKKNLIFQVDKLHHDEFSAVDHTFALNFWNF